MPKPRKTLDVDLVRTELNHRIRYCPSRDGRLALCSTLTALLLASDRYQGYGYCTVGDKMVSAEDVQKGRYDDSLRHYY